MSSGREQDADRMIKRRMRQVVFCAINLCN